MSVRVRCLLAALLVALGALPLTPPPALSGDLAVAVPSDEAMVAVGSPGGPEAARVAAEPRVKRSPTFHTVSRLLVVLAPLLGVAGVALVTRRRRDADAVAPALLRARTATPRAPPALAV